MRMVELILNSTPSAFYRSKSTPSVMHTGENNDFVCFVFVDGCDCRLDLSCSRTIRELASLR